MSARPGSHHEGRAQRARYFELRWAGLDQWAAARELVISERTMQRYERWAVEWDREVVEPRWQTEALGNDELKCIYCQRQSDRPHQDWCPLFPVRLCGPEQPRERKRSGGNENADRDSR